MKVILFFILSSFAFAQQIGISFWHEGLQSDTTTNIYVNSATGDESNDGLTYETPKLYLGTALSMIDAPQDTVYVSGTFHDSSYTITQGVIHAYSLTSKPIIFGGDTLTGFTDVAGDAGAAIVDTFYSSAGTDDCYRDNGTNIYTTTNALRFGNTYGTSIRHVGIRFVNITERAIFDSAKIELVGYGATSADNMVIRIGCQDEANPSTFSTYTDFDDGKALLTTGVETYSFTTDWADGTRYSFRVDSALSEIFTSYTYSGSQAIRFFILDNGSSSLAYRDASSIEENSGAEKPSLIIYSHGLSSQQYSWKITPQVYQVYFGNTIGTQVSDKSLIDAAAEWCWSGDTLYVYSTTSSILATKRNGFNVTGNATIAGFDIQKCVNGIKTSGTVDTLTIRQNNFKHNVYAILDTADGTSLINNNIITQNQTNLYLKNKDTSYVYNNTMFLSSYPTYPDANAVNITSTDSKLNFQNNVIYVGTPKVGTVDLEANIININSNLYAYWDSEANKFWSVEGTDYDSLNQFRTALDWEEDGWEIKSWRAAPYNDAIYIWHSPFTTTQNFTPRIDTVALLNSPLIDHGANVGLFKDYNGESVSVYTDVGAIEQSLEPTAPVLFSPSMYAYSDSAYLSWSYDEDISWDSVTIYANDQFIETIAITDEAYHKPDSSLTTAVPEVYAATDNQLGWQDSVNVTFWLTPNNSNTVYRVRYGIGSLTDSTAEVDTFIYIPQTTVYKILTSDATYEDSWSNEETLTYIDSVAITILLSGLSTDTTYTYDVTANNAVGYAQTDNYTFRIESPAPPAPVDYDWYVALGIDNDTTVSSISALNAKGTLINNKTVAFKGGETFYDAILICREGATYTSYGTGQATIGDSASSPLTHTIQIDYEDVTLNNLKIEGAPNREYIIKYTKGGLTIQNCEITGGAPYPKWTKGIYSGTTGITKKITIKNNLIHDVMYGVYPTNPYNVEICYNEIYNLYVYPGYSSVGGIAIFGGFTASSWSTDYTFHIHHNDIHHFEHSAIGISAMGRVLVEYNYIHDNLDERMYQGGVTNGSFGKIAEANYAVNAIGHIIRYNYTKNVGKFGQAGYSYRRPTSAEFLSIIAGTFDVADLVTSTSTGLWYPYYENAGNNNTGGALLTFPMSNLITSGGYGNQWIHNNIFYNCKGTIWNKALVDGTTTWRTDLSDYFINNTILQGGDSYATRDNTMLMTAAPAQSPNKIYNNIVDYVKTDGKSSARSQRKETYMGYNIYTNTSGVINISDLAEGALKAGWYQYSAYNWANEQGEQYSTDPNWVDTTSVTIEVFKAGTDSQAVYIPDVRLTVGGNAYNTGLAYSSIGDTYTDSYGTHEMGKDPLGRSFAYDIFGTLRTLNHIGAVKAVGE